MSNDQFNVYAGIMSGIATFCHYGKIHCQLFVNNVHCYLQWKHHLFSKLACQICNSQAVAEQWFFFLPANHEVDLFMSFLCAVKQGKCSVVRLSAIITAKFDFVQCSKWGDKTSLAVVSVERAFPFALYVVESMIKQMLFSAIMCFVLRNSRTKKSNCTVHPTLGQSVLPSSISTQMCAW